MLKIIIIIHIIFSLILISLILINKGKGSETGGITSTSTSDIFGSKGSSSLLNKLIITFAIFSIISNISLNITNKNIKKIQNDKIIKIKEYTKEN